MMMRLIFLLGLGVVCSCAPSSDDYETNLEQLVDVVKANQLTKDGYWLEMKNVADEWEKMILVFGYAGSGDKAACDEVRKYAAETAPGRLFRCYPVHQ